MNIIETISAIKKTIKVGATDGTSFFYVGTPACFIDNISSYSEQCAKQADSRRMAAYRLRQRKIHNAPTPEQYCLSHIGDETLSIAKYNKYVEKYFIEVMAANELYQQKKKEMEDFVPLNRRNVIETFDSNVDDSVVVMIEGHETGKFWLVVEANGSELGLVVGESKGETSDG